MSGSRRSHGHRSTGWYRDLRAVIDIVPTPCRRCRRLFRHCTVDDGGLRLGHLLPYSQGGRQGRENLTLTCGDCEAQLGESDQTERLPSLIDEPVEEVVPVGGLAAALSATEWPAWAKRMLA